MFYYKYNSGFWGSAGHGTEFVSYFENGNIKTKGWKEKKYAEIWFYDTLNNIECDEGKLTKLKKVSCIKFRSHWYIVPGDHADLGPYGFFKRRKLFRENKEKIYRIEIKWKDGFRIDEKILKEKIGTI